MGTRFLSNNERNILRPKLSRFGEIFRFATKPNRLTATPFIQGTLLSISSNGLGNKTIISCLFVVYSQTITPRYRGRPDALLPSAFGLVQ